MIIVVDDNNVNSAPNTNHHHKKLNGLCYYHICGVLASVFEMLPVKSHGGMNTKGLKTD
eukprot:NODE_1277_length_464_cov_126.747774_g1267_i0.p1 GENE.NODE_1277_length_464_cov_126.747774_g1267_i0~~NODE_1277_length_464_cov_126.747774_g1267_i0.p1  ORF type:complete len:59 (-),score=8.11 NODE_1277_length_464_cov_126.747774_g1267_i0:94-270(-)